MAVRAAVAGEPREHQPQTVQQFGSVPNVLRMPGMRDADAAPAPPGHTALHRPVPFAALVMRRRCKSKARPDTGGAFGIQHAKCQRRFARAGHARNPNNLMQRDIYIYVF